MPLSLNNKVSNNDIETIKSKKNTPEYEKGFEPDSYYSDDDFNFDNLDFNAIDNGNSSDNKDANINQNNLQSGQNGNLSNNNVTEKKEDFIDKIINKSGEAIKAFGNVLSIALKSIKNRNSEEWGLYFRNLILAGVTIVCIGVLLGIIGGITKFHLLNFNGVPLNLIVASGLWVVLGGVGVSIVGYKIIAKSTQTITVDDDIIETAANDEIFDYNDLDGYEDVSEASETDSGTEYDFTDVLFRDKVEDVNYDSELSQVHSNVPMLNREFLVNTFKNFFPCITPEYSNRRIISEDSDEFANLDTICTKALAAAAKIDFEEMEPSLERAIDTFFCYELWIKRIKGLNRFDDIAREINAYARENSDDTSVYSTVALEGDFYKITLFKGNVSKVTLGDVLKKSEVIEYFKDNKNMYPIVVGLKPNGEVILRDCRLFDSMMIVGQSRSGKTWFLFNIFISLFAFNSPEDVQAIIIDPKGSSMLYTLSLLPHVAGYHKHDNILQVLNDIIEIEGERREKLLKDHKCDDIWELYKLKGIKIPVLYVFIDEIMTVTATLGEASKELFELMKVIISQFPSKGIRLIFIPHRATGVVDATVRHLISFSAAFRANNDVIVETLNIKKFEQALPNTGDAAVMMTGETTAMYMRGISITGSDTENKELAVAMARAYYKMGIDMPDMSTLGSAYNRDEAAVQSELKYGDRTTRLQLQNS